MDTLTPGDRSARMALVRSRNNASTELKLAKLLREARLIGWRRNIKLLGSPDFVYPRFKVAIFVDGCFWHGCPKCFRLPKSRLEYWTSKIASNKRRDRRVTRALKSRGLTIVRIWEHDLKAPGRVLRKLSRILEARKVGNESVPGESAQRGRRAPSGKALTGKGVNCQQGFATALTKKTSQHIT